MCLALPGRLVEITDSAQHVGRIEVGGRSRVVNLSLVEDIAVGDWVLVDMGLAVARVTEAEALETLRLLEEMIRAAQAADGSVQEEAP